MLRLKRWIQTLSGDGRRALVMTARLCLSDSMWAAAACEGVDMLSVLNADWHPELMAVVIGQVHTWVDELLALCEHCAYKRDQTRSTWAQGKDSGRHTCKAAGCACRSQSLLFCVTLPFQETFFIVIVWGTQTLASQTLVHKHWYTNTGYTNTALLQSTNSQLLYS